MFMFTIDRSNVVSWRWAYHNRVCWCANTNSAILCLRKKKWKLIKPQMYSVRQISMWLITAGQLWWTLQIIRPSGEFLLCTINIHPIIKCRGKLPRMLHHVCIVYVFFISQLWDPDQLLVTRGNKTHRVVIYFDWLVRTIVQYERLA